MCEFVFDEVVFCVLIFAFDEDDDVEQHKNSCSLSLLGWGEMLGKIE